ncbi:MAG TPA: ATP-binding domain-containing protein [Steroidobacter sp.]|uniref:DEAD/DEAH box helicase n=1 Tax=Steroidobacter sp. TaxID=1978227 RepID=UPI002EDAA4BC
MTSAVSIIRGTNNKPAASRALADYFASDGENTGELLIGFPIIGTAEGRHPIDAVLISPERGIVIFDMIEGTEPGDFADRQDDSANKLEARLKTYRELTRGRELIVPINTLSFAPGIANPEKHADNGHLLANRDTLGESLSEFKWRESSTTVYAAALSAIQSISTIRKSRTKRSIAKPDSRGAKLKHLEDSIATLDNLQSKAVLETVEGVQRIRGLAGSGKTIILALKAAYLHAQHPDWRIAVTFNTRSLKGHFRRLINNFSLEQTGEEPDWDNVRILNAWGAPGGGEREGIYHEFCRAHDIEYLDFRMAKAQFGSSRAFAGVCSRALSQMQKPKALYDFILVDEAQDFPPEFLRLCYELLDKNKRLVYAYDELQNLSGASVPPPEEIFGKSASGSPRVRFEEPELGKPRHDVILEKCYRNSRPVLVSAHALGFGIYREPARKGATGLVQMFDQPPLWEEIGYVVKSGALTPGSKVVLARTEATSPSFLEKHSPIDDLAHFVRFDSEDAQAEWVAKQIQHNLSQDELRHDDIVVINPDPLTTRERVGPIRKRLLDMRISSHLAGVDTDPDVFFQSDTPSITFTGIYRAKGNEAGMVYIINAQDCFAGWNLASVRNRLFTAITRSKAWVRVVGFGDAMDGLIQEFERLKNNNFELRFKYPTDEERKELMIVHRDMTAEERKRLRSRNKGLEELVSDLEEGTVQAEDLDDDLLEKLRDLLMRRR